MKRWILILLMSFAAGMAPAQTDSGGSLRFHEDYYLGFSQGVYYGLMLGGIDYDVAWCMKGELDYAGPAVGTGGEFQQNMQRMLDGCREGGPQDP
jgi:hypothetical protein